MCIAETRAMPSRTPLFCTIVRDLVGDADELLALLRVEPEVVGKYVHLVIWSSGYLVID